MTPLYLKHVALQQFRSFATLDLELPAEPGVLIVHGSNGLGKSSLFDALEWTLSDQIDHFRDASGVNKPGTYLCRWRDGEPGPTSAKMTFSDNNTIERRLLSAKSSKSELDGSVPDITAFLRAPAWQQRISELQRYLLLTHFLGQSTLSRLTHRKSTERFDILKEAAQSTAIEAIANALHGQGNTTVVRAYARQIEALERDTKVLDDLLEHEAALWGEAQISGAIDEVTAALEINRIAEQIASALLGDHEAANLVGIEVDSTVNGLQAIIDKIEHQCLDAESKLEEARQLHSEGQRASANIAEVDASRAATQMRLSVLTKEHSQAKILQSDCRRKVTTLQEAVARASAAVSHIIALRNVRTLIAKLTTEYRDSVVARTAAEQAKATAERDVTLVERKRQILQRITDEIRECDEETVALRASIATVDQAITCETRIRDQANALSKLEADHPDIDRAVELAEKAVADTIESVSAQAGIVESLRDTVDTMSSAIASIATHLPPDACHCPLCATHFDSASTLQAKVSTAAQRLAPALLAQEEVLKSLSATRDAGVAELEHLRVAQSVIRSARLALGAEREQRVQLLMRLDGGSTEKSYTLTARRAHLVGSVAATSARRYRKVRWQMHPALGEQALNVEHAHAIRARDAAQRALDAATRAVADLTTTLERARTDEADANYALGAEREVSPDELPDMLLQTEMTSKSAQEEFTEAKRALSEADTAVATLEAEQAGLQARLIEIDSRKTALSQSQHRIGNDWLALEWFGSTPDLAPVQTLERRITASRLVAREAAVQLARLREGRLAWAKQLSHRAILEQIGEQIDGPPNLAREELLERAISLRVQRKAEVEAVRQVKEIAKAASADITAELEDFNSEYIKPLGFLMSRINQAILCDPRVGIDLHVKRKKIEQSAVKVGEVPKGVGEIDPVLVHSEGQMAALAVSMLCAASLTFPWSRWKALVLDDPLQHNDAIHAAAFADLMGNLVSAEGYQIFLSTHDVAQAEFLQRKFRSRRIPCTTLNLLGLGKNGVEWSVQSSSLTNPQAASA